MTTVDCYSFSDRARLQYRLTLFFAQHDPHRASDIVNRSIDLAVTEEDMFEKACKKYFVDPADEKRRAAELMLLDKIDADDRSSNSQLRFSPSDAAKRVREKISQLKALHPQPVVGYQGNRRARLRQTLLDMFEAGELALSAAERKERAELLMGGHVSEDALLSRVAVALDLEEEGNLSSTEAAVAAVPLDEMKTTNHPPPGPAENKVNEVIEQKEEQQQQQQVQVEEQPQRQQTAAAVAATVNSDVPVNLYFGANQNRFRNRVSNFYGRCDPDSLDKVERVLEMEVTEQQIFETLCRKWSKAREEEEAESRAEDVFPADECPGSAGGPVCLYSAQDQRRFVRRLENFYAKFHPDGLKMIEAVLGMRNDEGSIMRRLVTRYGVFRGGGGGGSGGGNAAPPTSDEVDDAVAAEEEDSFQAKLLPDKMVPRRRRQQQQQTSSDALPAAVVAASTSPPPPCSSSSCCSGSPFVADYNDSCKNRLKMRLSSFYQRHTGDPAAGLAKLDGICVMQENEGAILATLCTRYGVSEADERLEADFLNTLPVCCYDSENRARFEQRVKKFYQLHFLHGLKRLAKVLCMPETESCIMETLCKNHSVPPAQERGEAAAVDALPKTLGRNLPPGQRPVCEYPTSEKMRLRRRVEKFYDLHCIPAKSISLPEAAQRCLLVSEMAATEGEIVAKLRQKYVVSEEDEVNEARVFFLLPVFQ